MNWDYLFVVYRVDKFHLRPGMTPDWSIVVSVKEILNTEDEALREVERLNALTAGKDVEYHFERARYYRSGR